MKYSETGQFTPEMIKLAKEIKSRIKKLRGLGCVVMAKQTCLEVFTVEDFRHCDEDHTSDYIVKSLDCGDIDDSGADDEEWFEKGYITED